MEIVERRLGALRRTHRRARPDHGGAHAAHAGRGGGACVARVLQHRVFRRCGGGNAHDAACRGGDEAPVLAGARIRGAGGCGGRHASRRAADRPAGGGAADVQPAVLDRRADQERAHRARQVVLGRGGRDGLARQDRLRRAGGMARRGGGRARSPHIRLPRG